MNIIKQKHIFLGISGLLVIAAVVSISLFGLKQGIDFAGGTLWELRASRGTLTVSELTAVFTKDLKRSDATVNEDTSHSIFLVRFGEVSENDHQQYLAVLKAKLPALEELSFESIGPAIGQELRVKAWWAFVLVLVAISLYIAFAFRKVSRPVSSWKYGIITLVTLFHDAIIPAGLFAYLGSRYGLEVGVNFIVAILVVIGFSVHDTIVVFDRIRENIHLERGASSGFADLVNKSILQTFARSVNTSLTLVIVLVALYLFGSSSLTYFVLTILVGTVIGTYSSIFVASPLLVLWNRQR